MRAFPKAIPVTSQERPCPARDAPDLSFLDAPWLAMLEAVADGPSSVVTSAEELEQVAADFSVQVAAAASVEEVVVSVLVCSVVVEAAEVDMAGLGVAPGASVAAEMAKALWKSLVKPSGSQTVPSAQLNTALHSPDAHLWKVLDKQYHAPSAPAQDDPTSIALFWRGKLAWSRWAVPSEGRGVGAVEDVVCTANATVSWTMVARIPFILEEDRLCETRRAIWWCVVTAGFGARWRWNLQMLGLTTSVFLEW